jgi:hypothetical protein
MPVQEEGRAGVTPTLQNKEGARCIVALKKRNKSGESAVETPRSRTEGFLDCAQNDRR